MLLFDERLSTVQWIGTGVVLAGVWTMTASPPSASPEHRSPSLSGERSSLG
jgi:drug/metabolite transporter (DMT)-like permease